MIAKIKPEWVLYGLAAGIGVVVLLYMAKSGKDNNADGSPDGFFRSLGFSAGRAPVDAAVGVFDGALDALADPIGGSYADCAAAKSSGNKFGVYWACGPSDWPIFE